jgi:2'-5' RNA ligase
MPAFTVEFDRVISFTRGSGESPLVLYSHGSAETLRTFQGTLGVAMAKSGLSEWVKDRFTPHVTLLYDYSSMIDQAVRPVSWTVREFTLLHSLLGAHRHTVLARWPLRD